MSDWGDQSSMSDDDDSFPADSSSPASLPRVKTSSSIRSQRGSKAKRVGNYLIGATLGKGSFGIVKVGTHIETGVEYALKFLSKKQVTDISEVERLFRESAILTSLKCDNVIRLYEVIDEPNHIVMVMELARGGDLLDLIKERTALPEREACRLFAEIVTGVEYCHKKQVVHRDLKLENILIVNGKVKVADFGLSNTGILGKGELGTACGTPSYLAPEQISRETGGSVGVQADIWAMGVILYAMVAGFLPFQAKSTPALFKRILNLEFGYPDYFSDELRDLIGRMLTQDPENRATIAEIKSHPWYMMDLSDLADSCDRQVSDDQVRQARDKLNERATPTAKPISRKASENNKSSSSSPSGKSSSKPASPSNKRLDSIGLPPVPSSSTSGKSHQRVASTTQPPRLNRGNSSGLSAGSSNGSGVGQFRMRPNNQRLASMDIAPSTVKSAGISRVRSYTRPSDLGPDPRLDDSSVDDLKLTMTPAPIPDRTRPLPKIPPKKISADDVVDHAKRSEN